MGVSVGMTLSKHVWAMSSDPANYRVKWIAKSNGSQRKLMIPNPPLMAIQRMILDDVLADVPIHQRAMGYRKGFNSTHMRMYHSGSREVLHLDIQDFFPSITYPRIVRCLLGCDIAEPSSIAAICTVWDSNRRTLPQGAPTSPCISNIVAYMLDRRIYAFALLHRLQYTRYSDNIIISAERTGRFTDRVVHRLHEIVGQEGFVINSTKTFIKSCHTTEPLSVVGMTF